MRVTKEEMALLQVILGPSNNGSHPPYAEAIQLMKLWRKRGINPADFSLLGADAKLDKKESAPLRVPPSSPPLESSSSSFSVTPPKEKTEAGVRDRRRIKLSVQSVIDAVPPDLTLQSPSFLKAWRCWVENRLQLPKPTLGAFEAHMTICKRLGESRAITAINHSVANSWLSIFEPRSAKPEKIEKVGSSL